MSPERELDHKWMRRAIEIARGARPSPNPPVGAVLVDKAGEIIAETFHLEAGGAHAEVLALEQTGEAARLGTLYVTLEPCNHEGQTPPCVDAILRAGVRRVVIGCIDPNPHVTGGGAERLRAAGIEVELGVAAAEARALVAPWAKFITTGVPFVSLKLALSLDGRIATRTGVSKWVTGPEARTKVQELRAAHDAVAVGIGTALSDDPRLTVRDALRLGTARPPVRVVFDTKLRLLPSSRLVETAMAVPTWVCTGANAPEEAERVLLQAGCSVLRLPMTREGRVDVAAALVELGAQGIVSVMFEGGAELAGTLLAARLADELHGFISPKLFGPRGRPGAVDWAGPDTPAEAPCITTPRWEVCGHDAYVHGRIHFSERE
ncbi:MAG: bifunctional diaminohydroxyphosphoribosylaminopyrimidine deaminase/5-amino-6-(5-phosphoribosylamino)uracil reductase RibD [Myxococcales bacterium]|nr:bifunctional diaminohydroxyphosphoribosylaminopyrimidine deaminase/5-amino-6-(5-phosphoribosylamino)uracil reductase RibD [Myxococcales bacterium]